jgi:hypothetical protein
MTATTSPTGQRSRCTAQVTNGTHSYPCNRFAVKGDVDGYCGIHRQMHAPVAEYTCTACWRVVRRGVDGGACVDHADRPKDSRYT